MSINPYASPQSDVQTHSRDTTPPRIFTLHGRIGRLRYLAWTWGLLMLSMPVLLLLAALLPKTLIEGLGTAAAIGYTVLISVLGIRRLHDFNASGWLILINLIPGISVIFSLVLTLLPGTTGINRFGPAPAPNGRGLWWVVWLTLGLMLLGVVLAVLIPVLARHG